MTLKEMMLDNIQTNQSAAIMQLGAQPSQKPNAGGNSAFGEIFGSKVASTSKQINMKKSDPCAVVDRRDSEKAAALEDSKPKYLTYREANRNNLKETSASSAAYKARVSGDNDSRTDELEDDTKGKTARYNTQNNMIQALAQVLGLNMQELQKLLKEAGISSESFSNLNDISENATKMAQLLGLNEEQKGTLEKLLGLAVEVIHTDGTASEETGIQTVLKDETLHDMTKDIAGKLRATGNEQETAQTKLELDPLTEKLSAEIKARLSELGGKLENDQSAVEDELRQSMQQVSGKTAARIQESLKMTNDANVNDVQEPEITAAAGAENSSAKNGETEEKTVNVPAVQQPVSAVKTEQTQSVFAVAQTEKTVNAEVTEKANAVRTPVEPKEILSQVIEKAKVILTPDKSEMIMDLKPESLGKISLKVVTENGMVMAKFVADSQQVKQVLESNMQLLKDSLERQGMNVQGFSVSVRQDSNRSAERWSQSEGSKSRSISGTAYRNAAIEGSLTAAAESSDRRNPYGWGSSTINLTA